MNADVVLLPGDGIGPEVTSAARRVLERVGDVFGLPLRLIEMPIGGAAIEARGNPLPEETLEACRTARAVLLGAVGAPRWSDPLSRVRPEQGLLRLRRELSLFANLRPVRARTAAAGHSPVRPELLEGVDILFVRELTGGLYFGPRQEMGDTGVAFDTMLYSRPEVERVSRVAFAAAARRRRLVTQVDKANVLAASRLWRRVVSEAAADYPNVRLEHQLVDSFAMALLQQPARFDVVLTENCFGDILTDEASVLAGSIGLLPSASLGEGSFGLYEPVHGSAPDIAGQGIANPVGAILSAAMLLRHSFDQEEAAAAIEAAVDSALDDGFATADLAVGGAVAISTGIFTEAVIGRIDEAAARRAHEGEEP